jgi:hypothetical protein
LDDFYLTRVPSGLTVFAETAGEDDANRAQIARIWLAATAKPPNKSYGFPAFGGGLGPKRTGEKRVAATRGNGRIWRFCGI